MSGKKGQQKRAAEGQLSTQSLHLFSHYNAGLAASGRLSVPGALARPGLWILVQRIQEALQSGREWSLQSKFLACAGMRKAQFGGMEEIAGKGNCRARSPRISRGAP